MIRVSAFHCLALPLVTLPRRPLASLCHSEVTKTNIYSKFHSAGCLRLSGRGTWHGTWHLVCTTRSVTAPKYCWSTKNGNPTRNIVGRKDYCVVLHCLDVGPQALEHRIAFGLRIIGTVLLYTMYSWRTGWYIKQACRPDEHLSVHSPSSRSELPSFCS